MRCQLFSAVCGMTTTLQVRTGSGSCLRAYDANSGQLLLNEQVFSGVRIHGISSHHSSSHSCEGNAHASPAAFSRCSGAVEQCAAWTLAIRGGRSLCAATLQLGSQSVYVSTLVQSAAAPPAEGPPHQHSQPRSSAVCGMALQRHAVLRPSRHWLLAAELLPQRAALPTATSVGHHSSQAMLQRSSGEHPSGAEAQAQVVVGLIDNSIELWHFWQSTDGTGSGGLPHRWRPQRIWRVECTQRLLLYCMDLSLHTEYTAQSGGLNAADDVNGADEEHNTVPHNSTARTTDGATSVDVAAGVLHTLPVQFSAAPHFCHSTNTRTDSTHGQVLVKHVRL